MCERGSKKKKIEKIEGREGGERGRERGKEERRRERREYSVSLHLSSSTPDSH